MTSNAGAKPIVASRKTETNVSRTTGHRRPLAAQSAATTGKPIRSKADPAAATATTTTVAAFRPSHGTSSNPIMEVMTDNPAPAVIARNA